MFGFIAVLIIYFYGAGSPPSFRAIDTGSMERCQAVVQAAKATALKDPKVRDAQGTCLAVAIPAPHDKV